MGWFKTSLVVWALIGPTAGEPASELRAEREAIRRRESASLSELAQRWVNQGDEAEADAVRSMIESSSPMDGPIRIFPLPEVVPASEERLASRPPRSPRPEALAIRAQFNEEFMRLALRAARAGRYAIADDCLRAILERDPDQAEARRLLGYVPYEGGWATPFAAKMLRQGRTPHPIYGWVSQDWLAHLERGQLPGRIVGGRPEQWLPADQADALRSEIQRGWEIFTPHFSIRTNVPLAQAITFGRRLEDFQDAFFAILGDVIGPELPLARRIQGQPDPSVRPHQVWYFADKAAYVAYLRRWHGSGVDLELGRYDPPRRRGEAGRSYFYRDESEAIPVTATLYHEASHQLLFESGTKSRYQANVGHFWVFEGLGTYFETVAPQPDGSLEIGGFVGPRLMVARQRLIEKKQILPIERLIKLSRTQFEGAGGGDVYLHYAEAMALTVFLMHGQGGRYRDHFLDYVADVLQGNFARGGNGRSLEDRLGVSHDELQDQFLGFLQNQAVPRP